MVQQVYGDNAISSTRIYEWHKRVKERQEAVKDDSRSGRPSTSRPEVNVERVKQVSCGDRRLTAQKDYRSAIHEKGECLQDYHRRFRHVESLLKRMPRLLNNDQKVCQDIIERLRTEPDLLCRVITGDEIWIFEYEPETKRPRSQCEFPNSQRPKKAKQWKSKVKSNADNDIRYEEYLARWVVATEQHDPSTGLPGDPAAYASLSACEVMIVVAG